MYRGILHYVELFEIVNIETELVIYKKKEPGFYFKIFPIENKSGYEPV